MAHMTSMLTCLTPRKPSIEGIDAGRPKVVLNAFRHISRVERHSFEREEADGTPRKRFGT